MLKHHYRAEVYFGQRYVNELLKLSYDGDGVVLLWLIEASKFSPRRNLKTAGSRFFSRNQAGVWGETLQTTNHSRPYCLSAFADKKILSLQTLGEKTVHQQYSNLTVI